MTLSPKDTPKHTTLTHSFLTAYPIVMAHKIFLTINMYADGCVLDIKCMTSNEILEASDFPQVATHLVHSQAQQCQ
jgi:hypothetical protein